MAQSELTLMRSSREIPSLRKGCGREATMSPSPTPSVLRCRAETRSKSIWNSQLRHPLGPGPVCRRLPRVKDK